jgi:hypothetical protein
MTLTPDGNKLIRRMNVKLKNGNESSWSEVYNKER